MSTTPKPESTEVATLPGAGTIARQEFGARELATLGEVAAQRAAAEVQALVQSRYVMAMQRPRDLDDVRVRIMKEVERPGFAEVAWYRKPIGKGVEGLSVRFAEAAARCMGNLLIEPHTTYEDAAKRNVKVSVTDLESNLTLSLDVTIEKTVERTQLNDGRVAISMRKNSQGQLTYTVPATEDEMLGKANSHVAKARRNLVLQILPGDIADAAKARILEIRRTGISRDPEAARRKVVDGFASLNVMPSDLKRYLGHDVAQCSPAEIEDLREVYTAVQSGEAKWLDVLAEKLGTTEEAAAPPPPKPGLGGVTDRLQQEGPKATSEQRTDPVGKVVEAVRTGEGVAEAVRGFVAGEGSIAGAAAAGATGDLNVCTHPELPTAIPPGQTVVCTLCGEEFTAEAPEPPALDPARDPARTPAPAKTDNKTAKGRTGRLIE